MDFSVERHGDTLVVGVRGQLIVANRQQLKECVLDELEKGERTFLIDLADTGYVDSAGLGALVSLRKKVRERGGDLRLANLNDDLKQLLRLTKVDTLLPCDVRDDHDGSAGRTAPWLPRPSGPLSGASEADAPRDRPQP